MRYVKISVVIVIMFVSMLHTSASALTNEEVFSQFQFNFLTPGARATALGGAFIGLADDATAIESNPAGLTQLYDPEVSIEYKYISYEMEQIFENFSGGTNISKKEFDSSVESIPFVSVAFPYKRFVFSMYRQELVNYKSSYQTSQFPIAIPGYSYFDGGWFFPIDASTDLTVTNYGIGVAVQPVEGLSIAVSPRWSELDMDSRSTRYRPDPAQFNDTDYYFPYPVDFSDEDQIVNETWIDDSDSEFSVNVGLMWRLQWLEEKLDIPRVSIGAVYRSGAKFQVTEAFSLEIVNAPDTYAGVSDITEFTIKVPDTFGIGVAVQPTDELTVTLDVIHIQYEDLLDDFDIVLAQDSEKKENYTVDNATEVHVGVEYVLTLGERLLALRAGAYYEPDHTIRFTGTTGDEFDDDAARILFPGGDDQFHVTGGVGLVVSEKFQIDTAANIADNCTQVSISTVYRF